MSHIKIGSFTLIGALFGFGGFALISLGPKIGPINFNAGLREFTDYDEQKARSARIAAEKKAERAALMRADAEKSAENAARWREALKKLEIENETGEIYNFNGFAFICIFDGDIGKCNKKREETTCPRTGEKGDWLTKLIWRRTPKDKIEVLHLNIC